MTAVCNELFVKVYKTQVRYCIVERLSSLIKNEISNDHNLLFLSTFIQLNDDPKMTGYTKDLFQNYNYNLFNLYSILKLYQNTFGMYEKNKII